MKVIGPGDFELVWIDDSDSVTIDNQKIVVS